jgi:NADH dehydrogenase FAD-containing subunit
MQVARELAQLLSREEDGRITLVDQNNVMLFTPMLTEVAGGEVHADHFSQVDDGVLGSGAVRASGRSAVGR